MHRVPEVIFQPTIIGVEQAGLGEVIETVLARYNANDQQKLAEVLSFGVTCFY